MLRKYLVFSFLLTVLLTNVTCAQNQKQADLPPPPPPSSGSNNIVSKHSNKEAIKINKAEALKNLEKQAKEFGEALINKNFEKTTDLSYTPIVKAKGGRGKWILMQKEAVEAAEKNGFKLTEFIVETPDKVSDICDTFTFGLLKNKLKFESSTHILEGISNFYAVSEDCGKNWQFVDLENMPKEVFEDMFSSIGWKYPEKEEPKVYKKQQ